MSAIPMQARRELRSRLRAQLPALFVAALLLGGLGTVASRSMTKPAIEAALLALDENAPFAQHGLERRALPMPSARGGRVAYLHLPSTLPPRRGLPADRPPVVLLHGTPGTLFTWGDVVFGGAGFEGLSGLGFEVYALELPSHGVATVELEPCTFAGCAAFVVEFLRAMDLERVHLVGQGSGGEIAWRAATAAPERVSRLVLIGSSGLPRALTAGERELLQDPTAAWDYLWNGPERVAGSLRPHFRGSLPDDLVEEARLVRQNAANWRAALDLLREEAAREAIIEVPAPSAPTLLIWGAGDLVYPVESCARPAAAAIPGARLEVIPRCGHYPHLEAPSAVVGLVRSFLES